MNTLATVLLTILVATNIFIISAVAWATMRFKDKSSRMGGMVLLMILIIDTLGMIGGVAL